MAPDLTAQRARVALTLAHALGAVSARRLEHLGQAVVEADPRAIAPFLADILFAFANRDVPPPPPVRARLAAALSFVTGDDLAARANREAATKLLGAPATDAIPPPGPLSWEELAAWATSAGSLAAPGLDRDLLVGREEDLLRGVVFALYRNNPQLAGGLLRWLALRPPAEPLFERALHDALTMAHRAEQVVPAVAALALLRRSKEAGTPPATPPATSTIAAAAPEGSPAPPSPPSPAVRHELVERALGWVERNLGRFGLTVDLREERGRAQLKAIGELANVAEHCVIDGTRTQVELWVRAGRRFLEYAVAQVGDGDRLAALIEERPDLVPFATIMTPFHRAGGLRGERLRRALVQHAAAAPRELAFFMACTLDEIGLAAPWDLEEAWSWTMLAAEPPPWRLATHELYLVIHDAWYRARKGWPDARGRAYVTRWLPVWLRHCELSSHHDLLAELIITWHELHGTAAPAHAWSILGAAQREDGAVPMGEVPDGEYHSTLTAIWAGVSCP